MTTDESTDQADAVSLPTDDLPADPTATIEPSGPAPASPVEATERLTTVDVLRGVALLGILAMNIVVMGWPPVVYGNPVRLPGYDRADLILWTFNAVVFNTKMMTIFSMLFGAGLVLMSGRAERRGASFRGVYFRRTGILLLIGLIHAYLIWDGDVLVPYALCGFGLYSLRDKSARTLIVVGALLLAVNLPLWLAARAVIPVLRETGEAVIAESEFGPPRPGSEPWVGWRYHAASTWKAIGGRDGGAKADKEFWETIDVHRGGYPGIVRHRTGQLVWEHTLGMVLFFWWAVGGRMVLGMGLMKLGVFSGERSPGFYRKLMLVGYGVGLPLVLIDVGANFRHHFFVGEELWYFEGGWHLINEASSPFLALGHVGAIVLFCKSGLLAGLKARLAAVGRMALSNYLFDSIVGTTLFFGYGGGLYGTLHRWGLYAIVLAIWAFQLWFSPIWLARFRFGPAEWVWRSLTYGRAQPFVREPTPEPVAPGQA